MIAVGAPAQLGVVRNPGSDVGTGELNNVYAGDDVQVHISSSIAVIQENDPSHDTDRAPNDKEEREREEATRVASLDLAKKRFAEEKKRRNSLT
ncbi:uncharacterized protein N7473_002068 [Penicillium subrubescens]|uniref:uncharacterized protein n=1 Tax=Penicillium subrubescens TaxID=1316194 RepID=UPI0025454728|nr:uncharacterized protein N7473_002068 [Penicillium subrubescens]KAJ5905152.1 hypothetical protein N7473_002068 [Penicillium subrubescens]